MRDRPVRRGPNECERSHPRLGRRIQPHGRGLRPEHRAAVRANRPRGRPTGGPATERAIPRRRHGHRATRLPAFAVRPATRRRRHRPRGQRDLCRVVPRGQCGDPEHPLGDAGLPQHCLPRQVVRWGRQQLGNPGPRSRPYLPGGPPRHQTRRPLCLQRMAIRFPARVLDPATAHRGARDGFALAGPGPNPRGSAAHSERPRGARARRPGVRPEGVDKGRFRPRRGLDENVPGLVPRPGRFRRLHRIPGVVRAGTAGDDAGGPPSIPGGLGDGTREVPNDGRRHRDALDTPLLPRRKGEEPIIRGIDAHKVYNAGVVTVHALRGVNLEIPRGEMVAIMGPSGCGKTTLLNCFSGLDDLTSGDVQIEGVSLSGMDDDAKSRYRSRRMGFVFQSYNLLPVLTAAENVELPLLVAKVPAKEARRKALVLMEQVELNGWAGHKPAQLSAGQQQRVAIARALVNNPAIVWADEPTGNLDSETSAQIMDLLVRLNREQGQTLVLVTHDAIVSSRAHRILRMRNGQIVEETRSA